MRSVKDGMTVPWSRSVRIVSSAVLIAVFCVTALPALSSPATDELNTYSRAEALVREHQWDKGLTLLKPLLESDPEDVRALNLTGLAFTGKGDLKQANEYFQKALEVNPRFVPALKNLAINEFSTKQLVAAERHLL